MSSDDMTHYSSFAAQTVTYVFSDVTPLYSIAVVAKLTTMHPQTLRQYDRLGLVVPYRVNGRNRLYSNNDVTKLQEIKKLTNANITLEGIRRILELQEEVRQLKAALTKFNRKADSI
jgi:MerR family transcriptional regulator/heat shock protein HspR